MSIGLTPKLSETANLVSQTVNQFGDSIYTTSQSTACLYRDITALSSGGNRDVVAYDGYLWFDADDDTNPTVGNIYYLPAENTYVKVDDVTHAKRLVTSDQTEKFIKCGVTKQRQIS